MKNSFLLTIIIALFLTCSASAQSDLAWIKHHMVTLSSTNMHGRGYVSKGREKAAKYIVRQFREYGLQSFAADSSFYQHYSFNVNTFPTTVELSINGKLIEAGTQYIVDAASSPYSGEKIKIIKVDLSKIKTKEQWEEFKTHSITNLDKGYLLQHADSLCKRLGVRPHVMASILPKGCFIVPQHNKLTWTVATDTVGATVFYVADTAMPKRPRKAKVHVETKFLQNAPSQNVIGMVRGTAVPDSFIIISAHYDHLGKMGYEATFTGASDNASGTATMLYMAKYYASHPQRYTMVFIGFSGEEAGLLGSEYFVNHPLFPIKSIRCLVNLDIMADGTNGVTVVNATEFPNEFGLLESINKQKNYLPEIRTRGKAKNSDHYYFSEQGVPAFFFYTNGGPGFYHDVFDRSGTISMKNVDKLCYLLQEFVKKLQN